jgi:hypothetical protein
MPPQPENTSFNMKRVRGNILKRFEYIYKEKESEKRYGERVSEKEVERQ